MSLRRRLRVLFVCFALELGVLAGVPMRPDEIRELMRTMNQARVVYVLPEDLDGGRPPDPPI